MVAGDAVVRHETGGRAACKHRRKPIRRETGGRAAVKHRPVLNGCGRCDVARRCAAVDNINKRQERSRTKRLAVEMGAIGERIDMKQAST